MTELSFLSWNLALLDRSAEAPAGWGVEHTEAAIRETVLTRSPDLVLFQELPRFVPFVETHGMLRANPESHSGHLAFLVRNELLEPAPAVRVIEGCAVLTTFGADLTVANVHLSPGTGASPERFEQLAAIVEASATAQLAVVGDTNLRHDEIEAVAASGLAVPNLPAPTWDSFSNRFHARGRRFRASFTRCLTSPGVTMTDLEVLDEPIEYEDHRFHLSDHFALVGVIHT